MSDNLPPLPEPQAKVWEYDQYGHGRFEDTEFFTEDQMREYAASAVAERDAEIAAEQRRSEMYADLVRRTAEALGLTSEDGWHELPERVEALRADAAAAVAAERAACADICDQHASVEGVAQRCAAAIRARGQA